MTTAMVPKQGWKHLVLAALIYRIGVFMGSSSNWLGSTSQSYLDFENLPENPINLFFANIPSNAASLTSQMRGSPLNHRQNHLRRATTPMPYPCGVVFFYHIPSTGGASINHWFRKYQNPANLKNDMNITYWQLWANVLREGGKHHPNPYRVESEFIKGMESFISSLPSYSHDGTEITRRKAEWRIAHAHLTSLHLNESERYLYKWRNQVEQKGCQMINTIMLRDPLNHAMSLYKVIPLKNLTREEWIRHLAPSIEVKGSHSVPEPSANGLWATQLDFFLYNNMLNRRNPFNDNKMRKVRRAMEILDRHFDIVTLSNHTEFLEKLLRMTNWTYIPMPKMNVYNEELTFTKKEVETLQKGLLANGDLDFVDAVRKRYYGHLDYMEDN